MKKDKIEEANVTVSLGDDYKIVKKSKVKRNNILYAIGGFILGIIITLLICGQ